MTAAPGKFSLVRPGALLNGLIEGIRLNSWQVLAPSRILIDPSSAGCSLRLHFLAALTRGRLGANYELCAHVPDRAS